MGTSLDQTLGSRIAGSEEILIINLIEFHQRTPKDDTPPRPPFCFLICVNLMDVK